MLAIEPSYLKRPRHSFARSQCPPAPAHAPGKSSPQTDTPSTPASITPSTRPPVAYVAPPHATPCHGMNTPGCHVQRPSTGPQYPSTPGPQYPSTPGPSFAPDDALMLCCSGAPVPCQHPGQHRHRQHRPRPRQVVRRALLYSAAPQHPRPGPYCRVRLNPAVQRTCIESDPPWGAVPRFDRAGGSLGLPTRRYVRRHRRSGRALALLCVSCRDANPGQKWPKPSLPTAPRSRVSPSNFRPRPTVTACRISVPLLCCPGGARTHKRIG